jgi:hypothetical protein
MLRQGLTGCGKRRFGPTRAGLAAISRAMLSNSSRLSSGERPGPWVNKLTWAGATPGSRMPATNAADNQCGSRDCMRLFLLRRRLLSSNFTAATSAGEAQALAVFLLCRCAFLIIKAGLSDPEIQTIDILLHCSSALVHSDRVAEADKGCSKTPVDLDRSCAELPDFIKRQR